MATCSSQVESLMEFAGIRQNSFFLRADSAERWEVYMPQYAI
jgi:hypothetical protein